MRARTSFMKNPAAETAGRLKLNICFQCHSRLSGILPTCSGSQERFWTSQNDRNKELRQRPQGVKFIKQWNTVGMVGKFDKATCRREYEK